MVVDVAVDDFLDGTVDFDRSCRMVVVAADELAK